MFFSDTITWLTQKESVRFESAPRQNVFRFWDVRAKDGFVISVVVKQLNITSAWDSKAFLKFGENTTDFRNSSDCFGWISLMDNKGEFNETFREFASRSSSGKLLFSSLSTEANLLFQLRAVRKKGKF